MDRDEFYALLAGKDEAAPEKDAWTLYWKGARPVRERIEGLLGVVPPEAPPIDLNSCCGTSNFAALVRSGAYLGGDRRVPPGSALGGGSFSVTWSRRPVPPLPVMMRSRCRQAQLPGHHGRPGAGK